MDQGISNYLTQILLDSTLEFQDLKFSCWKIRHTQSKNYLYKTRVDIIEIFKNFITQSVIVALVIVFAEIFNSSSNELL